MFRQCEGILIYFNVEAVLPTLQLVAGPEKISRATRFFLLRGWVVCAKIIDKNHRWSPVQVTAEVDLTERNKAIPEKHIKQIVVSNIKEPGIDGHFDDCTKEVLKGLEDDDSDTDE